MSDVLIMAYPHIEWAEDKQSFKVATVFQGVPLICLMTVPKEAFEHIEDTIEVILEHESLHLVLDRIEPLVSRRLDRILPYTHGFFGVK